MCFYLCLFDAGVGRKAQMFDVSYNLFRGSDRPNLLYTGPKHYLAFLHDFLQDNIVCNNDAIYTVGCITTL